MEPGTHQYQYGQLKRIFRYCCQAIQASIIKQEPNGLYHLELFEFSTSGPSFNVQLVDLGYADMDPLQFNMLPSSGKVRRMS